MGIRRGDADSTFSNSSNCSFFVAKDILSSLDFGNCIQSSKFSTSRVLTIVNDIGHDASISFDDDTNEFDHMSFSFENISPSNTSNSTTKIHTIDVSKSCTFHVNMTPKDGNSEQFATSETFHGATSYHMVKTILNVNVYTKGDARKFYFQAVASLCSSVLYIDQTENESKIENSKGQRAIDFSSCLIGSTYFRDIQLWNRSECPLMYQIRPQEGVTTGLAFADAETGSNLPFMKPLKVPSFASKRIRVSFKATSPGDETCVFFFDNIYSVFNAECLTVHYSVIDEKQSESIDILLDDKSILPQGESIHLQNCYVGMVHVQGLWIENKGDESFEVSMSSVKTKHHEIKFAFSRTFETYLERGTLPDFVSCSTIDDSFVPSGASVSPVMTSQSKEKRVIDNVRINADKTATSQKNSEHATITFLKYQEEADVKCVKLDFDDRIQLQSEIESNWKSYIPSVDVWGSSRLNYECVLPIGFLETLDVRQNDTARPLMGKSTILSKPRAYSGLTSGESIQLLPHTAIPVTVQYRPLRVDYEHSDQKYTSEDVNKRQFKLKFTFMKANGIFKRDLNFFARCCLSTVTVSPKILNLGECGLGEYKAANFTLTNHSELPTVVCPHVISDTLGVVEKEVRIAPKSSSVARLEYVARTVDTNYRRMITFENLYNTSNDLCAEVIAKNVDTHQVLMHSKYYKINTKNDKRQLQVYYDLCLYNLPNIRVIGIKNHSSDEEICLSLKISGKECVRDGCTGEENDVTLYRYSPGITENIVDNLDLRRSSKLQEIEDLKWGRDEKSPKKDPKMRESLGAPKPLHSVKKRMSSTMNEELTQAKTEAMTFESIDLQRTDSTLPETSLTNSLEEHMKTVSIMESSMFPVKLLGSTDLDCISAVQRSYKAWQEAVDSNSTITPLNEVNMITK